MGGGNSDGYTRNELFKLTEDQTLTDAGVQAIIDYGNYKISLERLSEILNINFYELSAAFDRYYKERSKDG